MSKAAEPLDFYPEQRFSCSRCGFCCSEFEVTATAGEVQNISRLVLPEMSVPAKSCFSPFKEGMSILNKDGEHHCRFMDEQGLCRIHRCAGAEAKPLACRLYPFNVHIWADGHISADLRYICPAVGGNDGQRIGEQTAHIQAMAEILRQREKVADTSYSEANPTELKQVRFVHEGIKAIFRNDSMPLAVRIYAAAKILDFHGQREMCQAIANADASFQDEAVKFVAKAEPLLDGEMARAAALPLRERIEFRSLLAGYLRDDATGKATPAGRFSRMWHFVCFGLGHGSLQQINDSCPDTAGIDIIKTVLPCDTDAAELYYTFLRSKLESMHFCSRYVHHYSYDLGLRHLLLTAPVCFSLASAFAAAEHKLRVDAAQMRRVLTYIDTTFSLSPYFRQNSTRQIIRRLSVPPVMAGLLNYLASVKK